MSSATFASTLSRILAAAGRPSIIVAAFSGGLDSTVLLHLLAENPPPASRIIAAHLNHGLRGADSEGDQEFCRQTAVSLSLDFATKTVDAATSARAEHLGLEEAGRILRYRFFHALAGPGGLVLTGHHADDQAETILMNLRRGAHRRGLAGMRELSAVPLPPGPERVAVARPLLSCGREILQAYALERGLDWRTDSSNADIVFFRNRLRHRVLPALERLMPGFRDRLLRRAALLRAEEDALAASGRDMALRLTRRENGGIVFRLDDEALVEPERLGYALRYIIEEETRSRLPHGSGLVRAVRLARSGRPGETISLPGRILARREADGIFFFFPGEETCPGDGIAHGSTVDSAVDEFILPAPPFSVQAGRLSISAEFVSCSGAVPELDARDRGVEWFDPAGIVWPLRLRAPRSGERFTPLGSPGSRKIQDMLVDEKIPRRTRAEPRVIADAEGALWIWPLRRGNRARINGPLALALRLSVRCNTDIPAVPKEI